MRPSGEVRHVGSTSVPGRSDPDVSTCVREFRSLARKSVAVANRGGSSVSGAAGTSRGARAPGQMPHPSSVSSDPTGVELDGPQQGAGVASLVALLAGHAPQEYGLSGPHWHGRRMSACTMLNIARTIRTVVRMRSIVSEHTPRRGSRKGDVSRSSGSRGLDAAPQASVPRLGGDLAGFLLERLALLFPAGFDALRDYGRR